MKAGVAKIDITPDKPVTLSGYASRKGLSTGVHDPLSARVLAFEAAGKRLVLVSVDIIGFYGGTDEYLRSALLKEFNLQPSELFLCGIHTHAAPTPTMDREHGNASNVEYMETLRGKLIDVVRQALGGMQPANIGLGVGYCPVGSNRRELRISDKGESSIVLGRNPYGPTDKEVLVMKVAKPDGAPLAVAFDYATHGTALGYDNYTISGDVPGLAEQFVEKILGSDVVAPVFIGASGNIDPWYRVLPGFNTEPGWIPEPVLLGTFLGEEVVHVYRDIKQTGPADKIATNYAALQLPAKPGDDVPADKNPGTLPFVVTVARARRCGFRRARRRGADGDRHGDQGGLTLRAHVHHHALQRGRRLPGPEGTARAGRLRSHRAVTSPPRPPTPSSASPSACCTTYDQRLARLPGGAFSLRNDEAA